MNNGGSRRYAVCPQGRTSSVGFNQSQSVPGVISPMGLVKKSKQRNYDLQVL